MAVSATIPNVKDVAIWLRSSKASEEISIDSQSHAKVLEYVQSFIVAVDICQMDIDIMQIWRVVQTRAYRNLRPRLRKKQSE